MTDSSMGARKKAERSGPGEVRSGEIGVGRRKLHLYCNWWWNARRPRPMLHWGNTRTFTANGRHYWLHDSFVSVWRLTKSLLRYLLLVSEISLRGWVNLQSYRPKNALFSIKFTQPGSKISVYLLLWPPPRVVWESWGGLDNGWCRVLRHPCMKWSFPPY